MSLWEYGVREGWRLSLAMTVLKLALLPLAVCALARLIGLPPLETQAITVLAAMPVGANVYLMAKAFGTLGAPVSSSIVLSTALAAVTSPVVIALTGGSLRGRGPLTLQMPSSLAMIDFATNPSIPNASTKNSTKVPKRPAFDCFARSKMMNSMYAMNAPMPNVTPNSVICASVNPNSVPSGTAQSAAAAPTRRPRRGRHATSRGRARERRAQSPPSASPSTPA